MADKRQITDRFLKSLRPAPAGTRIEVWDTAVPGFGIRVHDIEDANPARRGRAGRISFCLYARFTRGAASTRRTIGTWGAITLEDARRTAGAWRSLIDKGIDPAVVEAEAREKADRERALRIRHSFTAVAEHFIADKPKQERSGKLAERDLSELMVKADGGRIEAAVERARLRLRELAADAHRGTVLFIVHAYSLRQARELVAARLADTTGVVVIVAPRKVSR